MALFTDSDIVTAADLQAIDQECATVANSERITIDTTGGTSGICAQAVEECGQELQALLQTFAGYPVIGGVSWAHNAAVLNVGSIGINRPRLFLTQIVVDAQYAGFKSSLKRWVAYRAIALLYADAAGRKNKDNDRYATKRDWYLEKACKHFDTSVRPNGIPYVTSPLSCPGAIHEVGAGVWSQANVTQVAGVGPGTPVTYQVAITWVDGTRYTSPTDKGNGESGPSKAFPVVYDSAHNGVQVSIASLSTTAPALGTSQGILPRLKASGWNLYIGASADAMYLQNTSGPVDIGTTTYTVTGTPPLTGALMGTGQYADASMPIRNQIMRS